MRLLDIERQTTWCKSVEVTVRSVGRPIQHPDNGSWCQEIQITDIMGRDEVLMCYHNDPTCTDGKPKGMVEYHETGQHFYDIKWMDGWFKCRAAEAVVTEKLVPTVDNWWERKDRRISRMSCIKSAISYFELFNNPKPDVVDYDLIESVANKFLKYIYEDEKNNNDNLEGK